MILRLWCWREENPIKVHKHTIKAELGSDTAAVLRNVTYNTLYPSIDRRSHSGAALNVQFSQLRFIIFHFLKSQFR